MPQSQTAALPRPQEEEETDKSKQAQTEQKYVKVFRPDIESETRPAGVQPKRETKLLIVIGLSTIHDVCRITFMLYPIFIYWRTILRNGMLKSLQAYICLNIYTKSP